MRSPKKSDSPSNATRDVYPIRARHGLTVAAISQAQAAALTTLNDRSVSLGGCAVSLLDPRDIAGQIVAAAVNLQRVVVAGGVSGHELADALGANVLALRLSMARSESEQPHTGSDAA